MGKDREILKKVVGETLTITGGRLSAWPAIKMLQELEERHGDAFSIEKACDALDNLARAALRLKDELRNRQLEEKDKP